MKKLYYLSIYLTLFITILSPFSFYSIDVSAENFLGLQTESARTGIKEVVLNPAAGKIRIYLPDDIRPGDTISGTVSAEPDGKTEAERSKNEAELSGYVLELAGARQNAWEKVGNKLQSTIKFVLTAGTTPSGLLKSTTGTPISNFNVPVSSVGITTPQVSSPTPEDFKLPRLGQTGRPVQIHGPFDGDFSNTKLGRVNVDNVGGFGFDGKEFEILAESPRKAVFRSPEDVTGPMQIALTEGNVKKTGEFRNVGVNLSAPKTNLLKGEKTSLTVQVIGLQGIKDPIPVQIVATGTINLSGGNTQTIPIAPNKINREGIFTQVFNLTATQAGGFNVTATVMGPENTEKKCECKCELNDPPIVGAGRDKIRDGTTYSYKANVKTKTCEGENCSVASVTYAWSVVADGTTATYAVQNGTVNSDKFKVDVTGSGTLKVTVTVTVTCSDGTECSDTGSKTFDVRK